MADRASIRPRRCRRGERLRLGGRLGLGLASIRPRRCRRGERTDYHYYKCTTDGFNSASTLSSRRTIGATKHSCFGALSFNSASTLSSRRSRAADRRGSRRGARGFNSASTLSSRRTRNADAPRPGGDRQLQFGLDAVVEENVARAVGVAQRVRASIRPRRCRRGERYLRDLLRLTGTTLQFGLDAVVEENEG